MGLDAFIYCDCFERGDLKAQPKPEWKVFVDPRGGRDTEAEDPDAQMEFDRWDHKGACSHEDGILFGHYIGNMALVGVFREVLGRQPDVFPLILNRVVFSGTHCGDFLTVEEVKAIQPEVEALAQVHSNDSDRERVIREFETQMRELVECALWVNKPISF